MCTYNPCDSTKYPFVAEKLGLESWDKSNNPEIAEKLGLEIIDVEPNLTKGGSMRCSLQLSGGNNKIQPSVDKFVKLEEEMGFPGNDVFNTYSNKIAQSKSYFIDQINKLKNNNKIVAYGASATSTTLIYHYEMGEYIEYLVDDFEVKQGLYSPGYQIPCYHPDKIYEDMPDFIIILAWRYHEKIISKHNKKFIIILSINLILNSSS